MHCKSNFFVFLNVKLSCFLLYLRVVYLQYSTVEEAVVARGRLHNVVWPPCSPRTLKIDYSDDANVGMFVNLIKLTEMRLDFQYRCFELSYCSLLNISLRISYKVTK